MNHFDPLGIDAAAAALHTARQIVHDRAAAACGSRRRKLKNIESAIMDAIGAIARQGLTVNEIQAWR